MFYSQPAHSFVPISVSARQSTPYQAILLSLWAVFTPHLHPIESRSIPSMSSSALTPEVDTPQQSAGFYFEEDFNRVPAFHYVRKGLNPDGSSSELGEDAVDAYELSYPEAEYFWHTAGPRLARVLKTKDRMTLSSGLPSEEDWHEKLSHHMEQLLQLTDEELEQGLESIEDRLEQSLHSAEDELPTIVYRSKEEFNAAAETTGSQRITGLYGIPDGLVAITLPWHKDASISVGSAVPPEVDQKARQLDWERIAGTHIPPSDSGLVSFAELLSQALNAQRGFTSISDAKVRAKSIVKPLKMENSPFGSIEYTISGVRNSSSSALNFSDLFDRCTKATASWE